jgi:hypothetical protein
MMNMPQPSLTTSNSMQQIQGFFENKANAALANAINNINAKNLYEIACKRLVQGDDLTDEIPELKNVTKVQALQVLNALVKQAVAAIQAAWVLDSSYASLFSSTVRIQHKKNALFEQYDVEHQAHTEQGVVTIAIVTQGRIATVKVQGNEQAIELLSKQLVIAGLR